MVYIFFINIISVDKNMKSVVLRIIVTMIQKCSRTRLCDTYL
jgi:hypothetical protein